MWAALCVLWATSSHALTVRAGCSRRAALAGAGLSSFAKPAFAASLLAEKKVYTAADASYAFGDIVAARSALDRIDGLVRSGDFASVSKVLSGPPISAFKQDALVLVQAPVLDPEDKKQIGTVKRFGLGADVVIMLGGLSDAVESEDSASALSFGKKAKASLDEVIAIGKSNGL